MKHAVSIALSVLVLASAGCDFRERQQSVQAAAAPPKHAWDCMKVTLSKVDDAHYLHESQNTCDQQLDAVVVLVKFFDGDWNRIGVGAFLAQYVAPRERLRKVFPAPIDVRGFAFVGVRAIKEDTSEAFK